MTQVQKSTLYYPDRAPVQVQVEVELRSSPDEVWQALVDYSSWPRWFPNVKSCFESTPLPKVADNNPMYPLGSTRRIDIEGVIFDEEIITYEPSSNDPNQPKVWAFSVYETSQPIVKCMVERVVLEPVFDAESQSLGTRVRHAAGFEVVWYLPFLKPILKRNMKQSWTQAFQQLDQYIIQQKGGKK
jgi:Polyketide cyclase / dehydrase and lipid transport